jgi:hypothetical protein
MKKHIIAGALLVGASLAAIPAFAQGSPQVVTVTRVELKTVDAGFRASKVVGSTVYNDANESIGTIDDILITRDGKEPYAVLSVGGFLGMGTKLVVVRYDALKFGKDKVVLPGGTKDGLKSLPEFKYAAN